MVSYGSPPFLKIPHHPINPLSANRTLIPPPLQHNCTPITHTSMPHSFPRMKEHSVSWDRHTNTTFIVFFFVEGEERRRRGGIGGLGLFFLLFVHSPSPPPSSPNSNTGILIVFCIMDKRTILPLPTSPDDVITTHFVVIFTFFPS